MGEQKESEPQDAEEEDPGPELQQDGPLPAIDNVKGREFPDVDEAFLSTLTALVRDLTIATISRPSSHRTGDLPYGPASFLSPARSL